MTIVITIIICLTVLLTVSFVAECILQAYRYNQNKLAEVAKYDLDKQYEERKED